MSDLLGIAGNAVTAYQLALGTVSNNIANVSTDGYSRQEVSLAQAPPRQVGGSFLGTGVVYDRIKRQYDAFAELNLRTSTSELASQEPMVDYTNRVVDLMGSENAGLSSALTQFFSSARTLSTDPASTVMRGQFMRDAQGLASRFGLISSQLDLVDAESREALQSSVGAVNTLAQQLAEVNRQLSKQGIVERQPAELLDQRDRLLRDLSQHARLRTSYAANGAVTVSLGAVADRDLIVAPTGAVAVGLTKDPANAERTTLVLDPYGREPRTLAGITSGRLGGLLSFREQVLEGTRNVLDHLAKTLLTEINALHRSGVDGYGRKGGDLFAVEAGAARISGALKLAFTDPQRIAAAAQFRVIEAAGNVGSADATVTFANPVFRIPQDVSQVLVNNDHPSAAKVFSAAAGMPASVGSIAAGMRDVAIYLNDAQGSQQLQLITRDGRHLVGSALSQGDWNVIADSQGLVPKATYATDYLNRSGSDGYLDMRVFYGARADVRPLQAFDESGQPITSESGEGALQGARLREGLSAVASNAVLLNGVPLPALTSSVLSLTAPEVAAWINQAVDSQTDGRLDGISAAATNEVSAPLAQLRLDRSLTLNGVTIAQPLGGFASTTGLVNAINDSSAQSGVRAEIRGNQLVLTNTVGKEGLEISVGSTTPDGLNSLNIYSLTYMGRVQLSRSGEGGDTGMELTVGPAGTSSLLSDLGFRRDVLPASLESARVRTGAGEIPSGALTLNGVALTPALVPGAQGLTAFAAAQWLNNAIAAQPNEPRLAGVQARAFNELRVPPKDLRLDRSVVINNQVISPSGSAFASPSDLVDAINAVSAASLVRASLGSDGMLVLANTDGNEGRSMAIAGLVPDGTNALGLRQGTYAGQLALERSVANQADAALELGFGTGGKPSMLADLGFRTAAYIRGGVPDDVLVYVTDPDATQSSASQAKVSASYRGSPMDTAAGLRANPMELRFVEPGAGVAMRYVITDKATGTELAARDLDRLDDLAQGISYRGLKIAFSGQPRVGDTFLLDGNPDGKGNNDNIRALSALETAQLFAGGRTVGAAYIDQVNQMGNVSQQAAIAKDALTVVRDQAEEKRDKVAGVNLDEEAANLIRFQQAYQASAKVMQMASQLFDTMLQLR